MTAPRYEPHQVEWTPEKVDRLWGYYATNPAYRRQFFSAHSGAAIAARADRELSLGTKRVLDFGCGRGDLLAALFARGIAADGLEFSTSAVEETRTRFAGERLFRGVEHAAALPSAIADGAFDVVFLVEVVEHLLEDQLEPTLTEVRRLLGLGGQAFVTAPNAEDLSASAVRCPDCGATFHRWQHQRSLTPSSIAALFERHGFATESSEALFWGLTRAVELRTRLRNRGRAPRPHLLYVGSRR
jgi:SAM-dependent methyltransferase